MGSNPTHASISHFVIMSIIEILLLIVAVLIMAVILLQQRSSGLGGAFGGDATVFTSRRGAEGTLYRITIILGILFIALGLYLVYVQRPPKAVVPEATETTETTESVDAGSAEVTTEPTDQPAETTNE